MALRDVTLEDAVAGQSACETSGEPELLSSRPGLGGLKGLEKAREKKSGDEGEARFHDRKGDD